MKILYDYFTNTYVRLPTRKTKITLGKGINKTNHIRVPVHDKNIGLESLVKNFLKTNDKEQVDFFRKMVKNTVSRSHAKLLIYNNSVTLYNISSIGTKVKRNHSTIYVSDKEGLELKPDDEIHLGNWHIDYFQGSKAKKKTVLAKQYKLKS